MAREARFTPRLPPAPPADLSDEELGIGVADDDAPPVDALGAMLEDPRMKAALDQLIAQRVAELAAPTHGAPGPGFDTSAFDALAKSLGRMIELNAMQQPGYKKPLPADVIEDRLAGRVEFFSLLADYKRAGTPPSWIVGEKGFFECNSAHSYNEGDRIRTYLPPVEDFVPDNEEARKVHAAQMRWLGGPTPDIGEQVAAAQRAANQPPLVLGTIQPAAQNLPVELVERAEPADAPSGRKRQAGSLVPERHNVSLADRAQGAQGPVFVDAV